MEKLHYEGPVVLAILDGVGLAPDGPGNAVSKARTPFLGLSAREYLHVALNASGEAVGLTPGQMGNSEVGHNTIGSGQIIKHGLARINAAFETGEIFKSNAWKTLIKQVKTGSKRDKLDNIENVWYNGSIGAENQATLHFAGIFSDGGVHSHIKHLEQMISKAYEEGVRKIRVHAIFDGRDVAPQSEPKYLEHFAAFVSNFADADIKIASGGGRMTTVADRYENDWKVVKRGFDMMVYGKADYYFENPIDAIKTLRKQNPKIQDQDLPAFVVVDEKERPVGKINKGDALIYFDFRADRAVEIAMAFTYWDFPYFDRGDFRPDEIYFAGMTEYNSDTHVPEHRLVEPDTTTETLSGFLSSRGVSELAVSETVKFGHITYYFNGNSYQKYKKEEFIEVASDTEPFETRPWMKAAEITDAVIENLPAYQFVRLNFPGGDMVGHTADLDATIVAMESIDLSLKRIAEEVDKLGGVLIVTADHGNAEELLDEDGAPKTSHTTNLVPCIIYDNTKNREHYALNSLERPGLANLAATVALLLGFDTKDLPESWETALIRLV